MEWNNNNHFNFLDSSYRDGDKLKTNQHVKDLNMDTDIFTQIIENKNEKMIKEDGN